jgi:uncharacterized protein YciI
MLLMSGPCAPRTRWDLVARAESTDALCDFFARDPYKLEGLATHDSIEFSPVKSQTLLADWIS